MFPLVHSCDSFSKDNDSFQAKFNSLIALNQANRGDLVRSPTRSKLAQFLGQLNEGRDATSLWYFLSIHDSILFPLVDFLQWKDRIVRTTTNKTKKKQQQQLQQQQTGTLDSSKRSVQVSSNDVDESKRLRVS